MEITVLQLVGGILILFGVLGYKRGEIPWSFEISPYTGNKSTFHIDLTPEELKFKREGVAKGKWVRPFCAVIAILGGILVLFFEGDTIAFTI